ncbi:uncharacterized protein LOC134838469 [Culicoides brevitarsis]|uniref:uncharacterized protein LOC134838469 n=1 Tax=Culicoides brevitarsis TaxID=469753 RepID=UPI00307C18A7
MTTANEEYSRDELNPPAWLNDDFFQSAVRSFKQDETITVKNLVLRPGTKPGEHYASIMFRAEVTFDSKSSKNEKIMLILKTMPIEEGAKMDLLKETTAFSTETRMYEEILPEMERILKKIGDETRIGPTLVYASNDPAPVIVLIDESPNGFQTYSKGLDVEQIQVVVERIAKFHACSVFMNENGVDMKSFCDSPYELKEGRPDFLEELFMPTIRKAVEAFKTWDVDENLKNVLGKNLEVLAERIRDLFLNSEKRFYSVLMHADFHFKNMMYRNDGKKSEDYLLLDFQFCMWNTPASDIYSLINSVGDDDIREKHRNEIFEQYFVIFRGTLEKLGFQGKIPTFDDFQKELLRCSLIEYMFFIIFVPFQHVDWSSIDINAIMETKDFHSTVKGVWKNENFQAKFIKLVERLLPLGTFD